MKRGNHGAFSKAGTALTALSVVLGTDKAPPTEFRIFRKGENASEKGTFTFNEDSALSVMAEYARHNKPMRFDYNHGTLIPEPSTPEAALSAGTFVPEVREDGLYATQCKWTARAARLISDGEYGEFSPYFDHDKEGVVTRLINCALTNLPALDNIQSLVAASATPNKDQDMPCEACTALNTRLSAMDEECKALRAELSLFKKKDADGDVDMKTKATALTALTGQTSHAAALGTIEGWKKKAEGYDALVVESEKQAATALRAELTSVLNAGSKEGKVPGEPGAKGTVRDSLEQAVLKMGAGKITRDGVEWLTAHIVQLPKQVSTEGAKPPVDADGNSTIKLTADEEAMGDRIGLNKKTMLAVKIKKANDKKAAGAQA